MRWGCPTCGTVYALRLHAGCPRHPGTELVEEAQMPKNTVAEGPSNVDAEPGQPGHGEPAPDDTQPAEPDGEAESVQPAEPTADAEEEEPSPGSSSETSDGKPPTKPEPSEPESPKPAPTTASRSGKGRTASGTARSTGGSPTRTD